MLDSQQAQNDRKTASLVGVLFIVATVVYLLGGAIYGPATAPEDYLASAYPDRGTVVLGVLVEFACVLTIPLIATFLYPVLKRWHEGLALSYVVMRSLELVILIAVEVQTLSLIDVSEEYLRSDGVRTDGIEAVGAGIQSQVESTFTLYVLVFGVGAVILYGLLLRSRLVPRWLSTWGLVAAIWMLAGTVLIVTEAFSTSPAVEAVVVLPIAVNEMVLAGRLILRGFDEPVGVERGSQAPLMR